MTEEARKIREAALDEAAEKCSELGREFKARSLRAAYGSPDWLALMDRASQSDECAEAIRALKHKPPRSAT